MSSRPMPRFGEFQSLPRDGTFDVNAVVRTSQFCSKCSALIKVLPERIAEIRAEGRKDRSKILTHFTPYELDRGAEAGCHLCTMIRHSVLDGYIGTFGAVLSLEKFQSLLHIRVKLESSEHWLSGEQYLFLQTILDSGENRGGIGILNSSRFRSFPAAERAQGYSSPPSPNAASTISTASDATFETIRQWLGMCEALHPSCNQRLTTSFLPKRLLELGPNPNAPSARLVIPGDSGLNCSYVALSYCWGGVSSFTLTINNIDRLKANIDINILPKTIQDAIYVTVRLGFRYLWVDSLCIIQDSPLDWKSEAASMMDVYGNCALSIGALGAPHSDAGLFSLRDPLVYQPCFISSNQDNPLDRNVVDPEWFEQYFISQCFTNANLQNRGWAFQERLLAPRTVHFGVSAFWECGESFQQELFNVSLDYLLAKTLDQSFTMKQQFYKAVIALQKSAQESDEHSILDLWWNLLRTYSRCKLTHQTDRLIAMSGIIHTFQKLTGWENVMGLWRPHLIPDLLWRRKGDPMPPNDMPSWSWAGHNFEIEHRLPFWDTKMVLGHINEVRFLSKQCALIEIACRMIRIVELSASRYSKWSYQFTLEDCSVRNGRCMFDTGDFPLNDCLYALLFTKERLKFCGLVATPSREITGAFRRVGYFEFEVYSEEGSRLASEKKVDVKLV